MATLSLWYTPLTPVNFIISQVCTHDLKKALISLRQNGNEIASIFDQNHVDNHKNSMAGTSLIINLNQGDKVQVYMYTFTGLQDKPGNHLTQFMGFLIKANDKVTSKI